MEKCWFVIYTRSRCEKKVSSLLNKKNYENYCPLNKVIKQWTDRKKWILEPLFSSYVFVYIKPEEIINVRKTTNDIVNFVYWLGKPAIIKNEEVEAIKSYMGENVNVKIEKKAVNINDHVRIIRGPLVNVEGKITSINNNVVKLSLPSLGYILYADVKLTNIEILNTESYKIKKYFNDKGNTKIIINKNQLHTN